MERLRIPPRIVEIHAQLQETSKKLTALRQNWAAENKNILDLSNQLKKLDDTEKALCGSSKAYEQQKRKHQGISDQLASAQEFAPKLAAKIKLLEQECSTHKGNLSLLLGNYVFEYRLQVDREIQPLLDGYMNFVEAFLNDCRQVYESFGEVFLEGPTSVPGQLPFGWIRDYRQKKLAAANKSEIESTHKAEASVAVAQAPPSPEAPLAVEVVPEIAVPVVPMNQAEGPDVPPTPAAPLDSETVWGEPQREAEVADESEEVPAIADDGMDGATRP